MRNKSQPVKMGVLSTDEHLVAAAGSEPTSPMSDTRSPGVEELRLAPENCHNGSGAPLTKEIIIPAHTPLTVEINVQQNKPLLNGQTRSPDYEGIFSMHYFFLFCKELGWFFL